MYRLQLGNNKEIVDHRLRSKKFNVPTLIGKVKELSVGVSEVISVLCQLRPPTWAREFVARRADHYTTEALSASTRL